MKKKIEQTILEKAIVYVFKTVLKKLETQVELRRQSKSTLQNYGRVENHTIKLLGI